MRAADRLGAGLRKAEMFDLAFADQFLDRPRDVIDRHIGIDPVLIEKIDDICLKPLQRSFRDRLDMLRPAVDAAAARARLRIDVEAEFGLR
jgi:hypothetical protein